MADALAQYAGIGGDQSTPKRDITRRVGEVAESCARQFIGRPMLMDEPEDLSRMSCEVGREFGGDDEIDRSTTGARDIEQAPGFCSSKDLFFR